MKAEEKTPVRTSRTIEQRPSHDGFPKAAELIEMKPSQELSLQDGRIFNALIENAVGKLDEDVEHEISVMKLRGLKHKGSERVRDTVKALMTTLIEIPVVDKNGLDAVLRTQLLTENTLTFDEEDSRAMLRYRLTPTLRKIIQDSKRWGRLKGFVVYAFSSKYALALYEAIAVRINLRMDEQFFTVEEFRSLLGVPDGKYPRFPQLRQKVIDPAVLEVNGLSDFMAEIVPKREGGALRGKLIGFELRWRKKDKDEWKAALDELSRPRVGRRERLEGSVDRIV
jgi:hypothetical protein